MRWRERRYCPHSDVRGIYGDEINHTPGFRRMQCRDCGRLLDGPVGIAGMREVEASRMRAYRATQQSTDPSFCPPLAPGDDETCTHTPTCPPGSGGSE